MILIKNGKIITAAGLTIEKGDVLLKAGKIVEIGENLVSVDAQVVDAKDCWVLPGFIDAHCHLGLVEHGVGFSGLDVNEKTNPITPHLRALDGVYPQDPCFEDALAGGVTCVASGPGSTNTIGGQFVVLKTYGDSIDEMVIKTPLAMKCAFGENLKRTYGDKGKLPMTRMGNAALLRKTLTMAKRYEEKLTAARGDQKLEPAYDFEMEAMLPVMRKEIPLKAHAHRADDILTAIRVAKEFDLKLTLEHCTEGHLVAKHIKIANVPVITGPSFGTAGKLELKNGTFKTPSILVEEGILVAIMTDHPIVPISRLNICAGMAKRSGLSFEDAIKAITINAATILEIEDRVGSLEVGKDADVVIWNENPLELASEPIMTIIDGEIVYEKNF